ncbi:WD40 domain containing protein [Trichuris trichiura]|uniref:WD40 domain containing protein n=1 Tax=Trichuris trichiura TaxID=36087 RepID=A0A077Z215_TRITR|nr:WD40 domain containing protein [Trichuris trichiura]
MKLQRCTGDAQTSISFDWSRQGCGEVLFLGSERRLQCWNPAREESFQICQMEGETFWSLLKCCPKWTTSRSTTAEVSDTLLLASDDGKLCYLSSVGKVEKIISAHQGAVLCAAWSADCSSVATGGEDGHVKIWSRNGLLRLTLTIVDRPVYDLVWSPDGSRLLFCSDNALHVHNVQGTERAIRWKAHAGALLSIDWNSVNGYIVSASEDGRYKIWNENGKALYTSNNVKSSVASVSWSPDGHFLAVGFQQKLRLCTSSGDHIVCEEIIDGEVAKVAWSPDGSIVSVGSRDNELFIFYVHSETSRWYQLEASQLDNGSIEIKNLLNEAVELLETNSRICKFQLGWDHLVAATQTQCYIFRRSNWNTPVMFELKFPVCHITLAERIFMLTNGRTYVIFTYDGHLQSSFQIGGIDPSAVRFFDGDAVDLCNDSLCVRSLENRKRLECFDPTDGKRVDNATMLHCYDIIQVSVEQAGTKAGRKVAFVDINGSCFIGRLYAGRCLVKLGKIVQTVKFSDCTAMLLGVQDESLLLWCQPETAFVDAQLLPKTVLKKQSDIGKAARLEGFHGSQVVLRRSDGCLIFCMLNPFSFALHNHLQNREWEKSLQLCRQINDEALWATVAVEATLSGEVNVARYCYAVINEVEKIEFMNRTSDNFRDVDLCLLTGDVEKAEQLYLERKLVLEAILLNIDLNCWTRALEIACKQKSYVSLVFGLRQRYLIESENEESIEKFKQLEGEVEVDWTEIDNWLKTAMRY